MSLLGRKNELKEVGSRSATNATAKITALSSAVESDFFHNGKCAGGIFIKSDRTNSLRV